MYKRLSALLVLAIFLCSMIPMALAEEDNQSAGEPTETGNLTDIQPGYGTGKLLNGTEPQRDRLRAKIKEEVRDLKVKAVDMRAKIADVRAAYLSEKAKFMKVKNEYLNCTDLDREECKTKREDLRKNSKPYLLNAADLVLRELENLKNTVSSSQELTNDEIAKIVADIDAKISEVSDAKAVIENLGDNSTREEVNDAAKTIRKAWLDAKASLKLHLSQLVVAKLGNIIEKTETLEAKLQNIRDKLSEKGKDVSALDAKLSEFSAKVDLAKEKYTAAREKLMAAEPGNMGEVAKEVHQLFTESKQALKDARSLLREVVSEIKHLNQGNLDVKDTNTAAE
jgi:chromosome segregation ATPase